MPSHQSNPMMTVEQSLYLTTTWSPTTHQRSNSTPLFSTSKVSCSCLPIFQNLFNRTLSCMLHSVRWDEGEYFDDYCRIAFAFRLHLRHITRICSPQYPKVALLGRSSLLQQTKPLVSSNIHHDTSPNIL